MAIKDNIKNMRNLANHARQLNALKKKVAEDFAKGILTHERLDLYIKGSSD